MYSVQFKGHPQIHTLSSHSSLDSNTGISLALCSLQHEGWQAVMVWPHFLKSFGSPSELRFTQKLSNRPWLVQAWEQQQKKMKPARNTKNRERSTWNIHLRDTITSHHSFRQNPHRSPFHSIFQSFVTLLRVLIYPLGKFQSNKNFDIDPYWGFSLQGEFSKHSGFEIQRE